MELGKRIRQLRKQKKMTLVELSSLTGVAQASLSRIETGIMKGTIESHQKIAEALGHNISELYTGIDSKLEQLTVRSVEESKREAVVKTNNVRIDLLVNQLNVRKFAPTKITLPGSTVLEYEKQERDTDKFIWVNRGRVEVRFEAQTHQLNEGDSIYFDASYAHTVQNITADLSESVLFSVTSPANL